MIALCSKIWCLFDLDKNYGRLLSSSLNSEGFEITSTEVTFFTYENKVLAGE